MRNGVKIKNHGKGRKEIRNLVYYECAPCEININDVHLLRSIFRFFTIAICYHCQFHTFSIYEKKNEIFLYLNLSWYLAATGD